MGYEKTESKLDFIASLAVYLPVKYSIVARLIAPKKALRLLNLHIASCSLVPKVQVHQRKGIRFITGTLE